MTSPRRGSSASRSGARGRRARRRGPRWPSRGCDLSACGRSASDPSASNGSAPRRRVAAATSPRRDSGATEPRGARGSARGCGARRRAPRWRTGDGSARRSATPSTARHPRHRGVVTSVPRLRGAVARVPHARRGCGGAPIVRVSERAAGPGRRRGKRVPKTMGGTAKSASLRGAATRVSCSRDATTRVPHALGRLEGGPSTPRQGDGSPGRSRRRSDTNRREARSPHPRSVR